MISAINIPTMVRAETGAGNTRSALTTGTIVGGWHVMAARKLRHFPTDFQSLPPGPFAGFRALPDLIGYGVDMEGRVWGCLKSGGWGVADHWHPIKPTVREYGELRVLLRTASGPGWRTVHRLVLEAFVGPCPEGMECVHLNGDPSDNRLGNLRWAESSEPYADDPWSWTRAIYRPVVGFPGYLVGSDGTAWTTRGYANPRPMRFFRAENGYLRVGLEQDGKRHGRMVHRLVLEAFAGLCPPGMQACHYPDPDKTNNDIRNLRWDTPSGNMADAREQGRLVVGTMRKDAKLTEDDIRAIRGLVAVGIGQNETARRFGVMPSLIRRIVAREKWRHVL